MLFATVTDDQALVRAKLKERSGYRDAGDLPCGCGNKLHGCMVMALTSKVFKSKSRGQLFFASVFYGCNASP
jgi:hypothetical protein